MAEAAQDMQQNNPEMFQNIQQQVLQAQQQQQPNGQGGQGSGGAEPANKDSSSNGKGN